ncbi:glycosyltransferase, partial [Nitrosococcus oceani]|uniref:glycosyltransferase n=1 Tax=Nitrosococcus oceani TaxID=1229 RepID=UPI000560E999
LIADTPEGFAKQIVRAYDDEQLWTSLSNAGKVNIEEHFSFAVAERTLRTILQDGRNSKNTANQAMNA